LLANEFFRSTPHANNALLVIKSEALLDCIDWSAKNLLIADFTRYKWFEPTPNIFWEISKLCFSKLLFQAVRLLHLEITLCAQIL